MEIILDRALGKPDQKINVEEERERVSRAVQTFAGRVARTGMEIN